MATNSHVRWTPKEDRQLREWLQSNVTVHLIAAKLKRSTAAVLARAQILKVSTKQANRPFAVEGMSKRETPALAVGTRVKMSPLGAKRCPGLVNKIGTVIRTRTGRYSSLNIRFDGNKSTTSLHPDYVEALQ